jgi:hypothetical protein
MRRMRWRFWRWVHLRVNRLAWWAAGPPFRGFDKNTHWLWRLNDWLADRWIWSWRGQR